MEQKKSTVRRDKLITMEQRARNIWNRFSYFTAQPSEKQKFFETFPYPYMNGKLHLGHAFSLTKCDFNAWYKRLCGYNVLFPLSFHCTGMPISAAAKRLAQQLNTYGNPPKFQEQYIKTSQYWIIKQTGISDEEIIKLTQESKTKSPEQYKKQYNKMKDMGISEDQLKKLTQQLKVYGNPPKLSAQYIKKTQVSIMQQMGIPDQELIDFTNAEYWTKYFPPIARSHLKKYGTYIDFNRSFITTQLNPYYNSFIEWQFNILKAKNLIQFGKRPSIYSPKDKQMCADHDRRQGQGIGPQQYTLVKIKIIELNETMKKHLEGRKVYLVAATLRPQTMYGQTSVFLLPSGQYCAIQMKNDQVFICSERSARNMSYQNLTKKDEQVSVIAKFKGQQMMGIPLEAPLSSHKTIYTLPMMTISMKKGTGVVTCVPSDSPDDWMATSDLRNKKPLRDKYGITEQMVNLEPVPIIQIPNLGQLAAVAICQKMKIKSQNDKQLLAQAKDECYKKGFHDGKMIIGKYSGETVIAAKPKVKKDLIDENLAFQYYQPGGLVIARSGEECVVSYIDQWYINYGQQKWKKRVMEHVKNNFYCNSQILKNDLIYTVDWLKEWGLSRSFGLGTKLPFDKQYLIQSLSDSTIYMAFYTIAHFLQGNLEGSEVGILGIKPEDLTQNMWDYVFLGKQYKDGKVSLYKLKKMRESFLYWYPMDLRCSGKDLIKNHLTMSLFNHAAIWQDNPQLWPRGFYCNGFINVQGQKMSKSKGNFIILEQILNEYGADASRLACAQAGDSINDANFTSDIANSAIMQLSTLEMFFNKVLQNFSSYRGKQDICEQVAQIDKIFQSEMENQISKVKQSYDQMIYRDVVKHGLHDFVSTRDYYLLNCDTHKPRKDLIQRYIYLQLLFIYPICPHFGQVSYIDYFLSIASDKKYPQFIGFCEFPKVQKQINYGAIKSHNFYIKFMIKMRESMKKSKPKKGDVKFQKATIIYRENFQDYQLNTLKLLSDCVVDGNLRSDWRNQVKIQNKEEKTKVLMFGAFIAQQFKSLGLDVFSPNLPYSERGTLQRFLPNIKKEFQMQIEIVEVTKAPKRQNKGWEKTLNQVTPGNPKVVFD